MLRHKYPKTLHLPWSPGYSDTDVVLFSDTHFDGKQVVVTEKMDGENTTIYSDGYVHARSMDYSPHPSRDYVKRMAASLVGELPDGWRICGENLFAKHSIGYENLEDVFLVFSIWTEGLYGGFCLPWQETKDWCELLGLKTVPVLYEGLYDRSKLPTTIPAGSEGYVIRLAEGFAYEQFKSSVAKYVRADHVQTDEHWMHQPFVLNGRK